MRISDWSSDVCSADLLVGVLLPNPLPLARRQHLVADFHRQRRDAVVSLGPVAGARLVVGYAREIPPALAGVVDAAADEAAASGHQDHRPFAISIGRIPLPPQFQAAPHLAARALASTHPV